MVCAGLRSEHLTVQDPLVGYAARAGGLSSLRACRSGGVNLVDEPGFADCVGPAFIRAGRWHGIDGKSSREVVDELPVAVELLPELPLGQRSRARGVFATRHKNRHWFILCWFARGGNSARQDQVVCPKEFSHGS